MKSVLCVIPNPFDATSFYRGWGPLSHLRKIMPDTKFVEAMNVNYVTMMMHDALFIQRPTEQKHVELIMLAKKCNVPVWVDYDDNLFEVPIYNPQYAYYQRSEVRENIRNCLSLANLVTVSTDKLRDALDIYMDGEIAIVPNGFPDHIIDPFAEKHPRKNIISWRGSATHSEDLKELHHSIVALSWATEKDWSWAFFGDIDYKTHELLIDRKARFKIIPTLEPIDYLRYIHSVGAAIHVVPLADNVFNRCKSNISWIEGQYAGSICITPKFMDCDDLDAFKYTDNIHSKLIEAIAGQYPTIIGAEINLLSVENQKRLNLLEGLF